MSLLNQYISLKDNHLTHFLFTIKNYTFIIYITIPIIYTISVSMHRQTRGHTLIETGTVFLNIPIPKEQKRKGEGQRKREAIIIEMA